MIFIPDARCFFKPIQLQLADLQIESIPLILHALNNLHLVAIKKTSGPLC